MGIKYLYSLHIFLYAMLGFVGVALAWLLLAPAGKWTRTTRAQRLAAAYAT